eukprot:4249048-Pleurochrysis_carterae.AAC.1
MRWRDSRGTARAHANISGMRVLSSAGAPLSPPHPENPKGAVDSVQGAACVRRRGVGREHQPRTQCARGTADRSSKLLVVGLRSQAHS